MRKSTKYLEFYESCIKSLEMPTEGLCRCFRFDKNIEIFRPSNSDEQLLFDENKWTGYWADGRVRSKKGEFRDFTSLRQTIVLFMHEMELDRQKQKRKRK